MTPTYGHLLGTSGRKEHFVEIRGIRKLTSSDFLSERRICSLCLLPSPCHNFVTALLSVRDSSPLPCHDCILHQAWLKLQLTWRLQTRGCRPSQGRDQRYGLRARGNLLTGTSKIRAGFSPSGRPLSETLSKQHKGQRNRLRSGKIDSRTESKQETTLGLGPQFAGFICKSPPNMPSSCIIVFPSTLWMHLVHFLKLW